MRAWRFLDTEAPAERLSKIRAFEIVFLMILVAELWSRAIPRWGMLTGAYSANLALATLAAPLAVLWPTRRLAFATLAAGHGAILWREFPAAGNHVYLELVLCALAAFLDPRRSAEQTLYLRSARWLVCVVLFFGGVQKAVHGYYSHGQFLLYSLGASPRFATVFQFLVPQSEFARLAAYEGEVGDGPYLVDSTAFTVCSNAVYLVEIALVPLLLHPRTRKLGVICVIAFLTAVELGARELFFGLLYVNAVLLFWPTDLNRRLIGAFAAALAALLLVRLGVLPEMVFY